jgi:hypothetical protein
MMADSEKEQSKEEEQATPLLRSASLAKELEGEENEEMEEVEAPISVLPLATSQHSSRSSAKKATPLSQASSASRKQKGGKASIPKSSFSPIRSSPVKPINEVSE